MEGNSEPTQCCQVDLRPHHQNQPFPLDQRPALLPTILVRSTTDVLDSAGMGTELYRMDAGFSPRAPRCRQYTDLGYRMRHSGADCRGGGGRRPGIAPRQTVPEAD